MVDARAYSSSIARLRAAGLRPTRQRLALTKALFEGSNRHVTADLLHREVKADGAAISLATVYNALHQFTEAGMLREVLVEWGRSFFDTNVSDHYHFFVEETGELIDLPGEAIGLARLPEVPPGMTLSKIEITLHLTKNTT